MHNTEFNREGKERKQGKTRSKGRKRRRLYRRVKRDFLLLGMLLVIGAGLFGIYKGISAAVSYLIPAVGSGEDEVARLTRQGYPQSLLDLYERNEEARPFVEGYAKWQKGKEQEKSQIDITKDVRAGEIPYFLQWDERWGYETYGGDFMAVTGCGPTCLAMVYCGLTGDTEENPYELAKLAQSEGYYVEGAGSSWSMMEELAQEIGLTVVQIPFDEKNIIESLEKGIPIICIMGPGDFTTAGHFIVLRGVSESGNILVYDPNSRINSEKEWVISTIMSQTRNLWGYKF